MAKKDKDKIGSIDAMVKDTTEHDIDVVKYEENVVAKTQKELKQLKKEMVQDTASDFPSGTKNVAKKRKQGAMLAQKVNANIKNTYSAINKATAAELGLLAAIEAEFAKGLVNNFAGGTIASQKIKDATARQLVRDVAIQGSPAAAWWNRQAQSLQRKFTDKILQAVQNNWTIEQVIDAIRGTEAANFTNGIMSVSEIQAEALARTSVQTVANTSRMATLNANQDVIEAIQWLATLDGRTSDICQNLNGRKWTLPEYQPIGHSTPFPGPTAHWRCRSTQIPITKSFKDLPKKKQALVNPNAKNKMGDSAKETVTFTRYLKSLPSSELLALFGNAKVVRQFKAGKLTEAQALKLASKQPIDTKIMKQNLAALGISSFDDIDTKVFKGHGIQDAEKLIVNSPNEIALIYKKGKVDKVIVGDTDTVEFDWFTRKDLFDSVVSHNHTAASSFSTADIELFFKHKPKQYRVVMPVTDLQAGFLGSPGPMNQATLIMEKVAGGPDINTKDLMRRIREEREIYFKSILDAGDDVTINETQARFATFMSLKRVSDDVPGFNVKVEFSNGRIGVPESVDDLIEKLSKDRKVTIAEPEAVVLVKAKKLGLDVDSEDIADARVRGILKEMHPDRDSARFNLEKPEVWKSIQTFTKKNPEALVLPLNQFEQGATFNSLRYTFTPDIRDKGGPSNVAWINESMKQVFDKAGVDYIDPLRKLTLKERLAIQNVIDSGPVEEIFEFKKINELSNEAAIAAKTRNEIAKEKALKRIDSRKPGRLASLLEEYREKAYKDANALRAAKERLQRAQDAKDINKILIAKADIAEIESTMAIIGAGLKSPKLTPNFKPVPRFKNEKQVSFDELPDLDQSVRSATGKAKPVREAALSALDKARKNYDDAYQDFINMDISEFNELLNKSMRGDLLSEHESLVISRGIAGSSNKYSMIKDSFKPKSFNDLMQPDIRRNLLTNYQAYITIDTKLKRLRESKLLKKNPVDPITGRPIITNAEDAVLTNSLDKLISKPTTDKKYGKGYKVGNRFIPERNMEELLGFAEEGKYIIGQNRVEPFIQSLVDFADPRYDWTKVRNFKAMMNGTKAAPGILYNKTFQYTEKLRKQWEATRNISMQSTVALARKSEAGVNAISPDVLVSGPAATQATKMSKRMDKLIRYHNMSDDELLIHELVNNQRLDPQGLKSWTHRIKRPQQDALIRKAVDGDIVVLEPLDLRKKAFKDLSIAISDQRNDTKIADVNRRIGAIVLDARIYKQAKTNLTGKLDMSEFEPEWEIARSTNKTDMNLFEYGLTKKISKLGRLNQKSIDKIYSSANNKIDEAYRISTKSPKRAATLNAIDDQKIIADAVADRDKVLQTRENLVTRGRRAAKEALTAFASETVTASKFGKKLSEDMVRDAFKAGAAFDPTSQRLSTWIKGGRWPKEELGDRIIASIIDSDLSQGAMGPLAHQIGAMMARNAGATAGSEAYMQVGARILQQAEKQGFIKRTLKPLLDKNKDPIRDAQGNFKKAWHIEVMDDKLRNAAMSEPSLRRLSKLPQSTPPKFDIERPWEYDNGVTISKIFDKDVLERVYGNPNTVYRRAMEAKINTPFVISKPTVNFFEKLRASGLKNAEGEPIIPSWDLAIDPKSAAGLTNRSKTVQWNNIHAAAKMLSGDEQLYFKFTSDHRGRSYASGVVTPQGPPQAKAYFRFKTVDAIGNKRNADHFWTEMANRAGHDKLPKTKAIYEDWSLVEDKYGADAAKRRLTVQDYGFEAITPQYAKIWDDIDSGRFWKDPKARAWIDEYEDEWPEIFSAAEEVNNLRSHVERKLGKKMFTKDADGNYIMALTKAEVDDAILDFKPTLIPHIDGTTNAYQQMSMITKDEDLGLISNMQRGHKLYDAYYYTGLTIKADDEAVIAAAIKRDNNPLWRKGLKATKDKLAKHTPEDQFDIVGAYLKENHPKEYAKHKKSIKKALDIKKKAVEAMPEVFSEDATVSITDLRNLFKKPVMLQPYGAGMTTILNNIRKEAWALAKKNPEKYGFLDRGDNAKLIGQAVVEMNPIFYPKAREYQSFLKELINRYNAGIYNPVTRKYVVGADGRPAAQPLRYTLPNGVELNLDHKEMIDVPVEVALGNETGWLTTSIHTDKILGRKQLSSTAANMTHAHDAAWDHFWTDILRAKGVKNFVGIHDAAGTDFGNMDKLHDAWRQAGVKLYQDYDLFDNLLKQAAERGVNIEGLEPPKMGTLDVKELLDSEYAIH